MMSPTNRNQALPLPFSLVVHVAILMLSCSTSSAAYSYANRRYMNMHLRPNPAFIKDNRGPSNRATISILPIFLSCQRGQLTYHHVNNRDIFQVLHGRGSPLYLNSVKDNEELFGDELIKEMASEALIPVFYGMNVNDQGKQEDKKFKSAEKALKQALRRYQQNIITSPSLALCQSSSKDERQRDRKMLADLVLGTSIMRIRHYHLLRSKTDEDRKIDPIHVQGTEQPHESTSVNTQDEIEVQKRNTVRAMVDLHAKYLNMQIDGNGNGEGKEELEAAFENDVQRISIIHSLPLYLVKMLVEQYGVETVENMAAVFNESGPITLRRNEIKCSSDDKLCQRLLSDDCAEAVPLSVLDSGLDSRTFAAPRGCIRLMVNESWSPSKKSIWSMQAWRDGWFEVMDAGSQLIVEATEAKHGEVVIDYCAGNGGKTLALASRMNRLEGSTEENAASLIIAHDIVDERLRQIKGSLGRAGICGEDTNSSSSAAVIKTTLDMDITLYNDMVDCVLVDAPCSSLGVLRRRPSQRFELDEDKISNYFPNIQLEILVKAAQLVKPGGRLIYATCSISKYENEDVVDAFERDGDFNNLWERWPFNDFDCEPSADDIATENGKLHCRAIVPTTNGCDGFFIARWKRAL